MKIVKNKLLVLSILIVFNIILVAVANNFLKNKLGSLLLTPKIFVETKISGFANAVNNKLMALQTFIHSNRENQILKEQLKYYQSLPTKVVQLTNENQELKKAVNFVQSHSLQTKSHCTKAFIVYHHNYISHAIIEHHPKIKVGQLVCSHTNTILGMITHIQDNVAVITLNTDPKFRIAGVTQNQIQCVIAGSGKNRNLQVLYVDNDEKNQLIIGQVIFSSNDSTQNIPGIPIATITSINEDAIYAKPIEEIKSNQVVHIIVPQE